jgi:hypothetical protein
MTDRLIQYHSDRFNSEIQSDVSMLTDREKELVKLSLNKEWTNPKFKLRWFVGQTQITPFAKFRQWLLEIKAKEESIENMEYELAKFDVEYDRYQRMRDNAHDDLDKRLAEIEMWNTDRLRYTSKRRLQDWYLERQHLIDLLTEFMASDESKLPDGSGRSYMDIMDTEEEDIYEAQYWTNRLAKQAACDMIFYGRINSGNMDAILSLGAEQQAETLALTMNFSTQLQRYQLKLQTEIDKQLDGLGNNGVNSLTVPAPLESEDRSLPNQSKDTGDKLNVYNI